MWGCDIKHCLKKKNIPNTGSSQEAGSREQEKGGVVTLPRYCTASSEMGLSEKGRILQREKGDRAGRASASFVLQHGS